MSKIDQERLKDRLEWEGFTEAKISGDGNCQFRSLSDQLYKTTDRHEEIRQEVVEKLKSCPNSYKGFVPIDFREYVKNMSKKGVWGDHVTLRAAADVYGIKIVIYTSFKDSKPLEIVPKSKSFERVVYLSFCAEVHYNSIYLNEGFDRDGKKKKKNKKKK